MGSSESLNDVVNPVTCLCDTGRVLNNVSPKTDRLTNNPKQTTRKRQKWNIAQRQRKFYVTECEILCNRNRSWETWLNKLDCEVANIKLWAGGVAHNLRISKPVKRTTKIKENFGLSTFVFLLFGKWSTDDNRSSNMWHGVFLSWVWVIGCLQLHWADTTQCHIQGEYPSCWSW